MKRNGSALLIVLGVLSFLVVSAVAFSAYMRRARLPSSYLRRTVASRELAKAALARAVDEIDQAIADGQCTRKRSFHSFFLPVSESLRFPARGQYLPPDCW